MQRPHSTRAALAVLLLGTSLSATFPAAAAPSRASLVTIEQIGSYNHSAVTQIGGSLLPNRASVFIDGNSNGTGTIAGRTVAGMKMADRHRNQTGNGHTSHGNGNGYGHQGEDAADFVMPSFASGVVRQEGERNIALVGIKGDRNDFHIAQIGESNVAVQAVLGSDNAAVITQGSGAAPASHNVAIQLQVGSGNTAYAAQNGDHNIAKQVQVGPLGALVTLASSSASAPEELLESSSLLRGAEGNVSLLEQNGDYNTALLLQAGANNLIALRQPGQAFASITQIGSGHQVRIEQSAGSHGVTPLIVIQGGYGGGSD